MGNKNCHGPAAGQKKVKRGPLFYMGLLVVLGLSALIGHFTQSPHGGNCRVYGVTLLLETDREAALELYADTGRGFHERDHQEMAIVTTGKKSRVEFIVPAWKQFTKFRIDPVGASVEMKIYEIAVATPDDSFRHTVSLEDITPVQQISGGHWSGEYYSFKTFPDATDPILLVEDINDPHVLVQEKSILIYALWICAGLFAVLLGNWGYRFFILGL